MFGLCVFSSIGRIQDDAIEQTATELDLCERMITELDEQVQQAVMLQYQGGRPTGAIGLPSRMAHYANRLARLPRPALSQDQETQITRVSRNIKRKRDKLATDNRNRSPII